MVVEVQEDYSRFQKDMIGKSTSVNDIWIPQALLAAGSRASGFHNHV